MSSDSSSSSQQNGSRVAVIGAGPGGYPAAFLAADYGFDVTLIDPRPELGGVCLQEGCIPSKTLLHQARLINEARAAEACGVRFTEPKIDIDQLREHTRLVIERLSGGLASGRKRRKVKRIQGRARFSDARTLSIEPSESAGGEVPEELEFDHAILATGSSAVTLPGMDPEEHSAVWDAADALALPEIPRTLLVVGGGYIGLEMGTVYAALGARVTVVEMTGSLLPGIDPELVKPLRERLEGDGPGAFEEVLLRTRVEGMEPYAHGLEVSLADADGETRSRRFEKVMIAVGRRPNSDDLGLEKIDVEPDEDGFLPVDEQRRLGGHEHLFAIGDVAGEPMLAHRATHEARVAVEAIAGKPTAFDPAAVPAVVFTDPEIAWAGLMEDDARERGIEVSTAIFPWKASGRAVANDRVDGLTKLIVESPTERVMGIGIAGAGAGELIGEAALAIEMGALAKDLARTIHAHPTLSETLMQAADSWYGTLVE